MDLELALDKNLTLYYPSYGLHYSKPVGKRTLIYKIHLTFGGGMGGGSSTIYSPILEEHDKYFEIRNFITGENMKIFPGSIVSITETYLQKFIMKSNSNSKEEEYAFYEIGLCPVDNITFRDYDSNRKNTNLVFYNRKN